MNKIKKIEKILSGEQVDFLTEMMNIGAGHATTALTQILGCKVDTIVPKVMALPMPHLTTTFKDPSLPVTAVKMDMVGSITGCTFFVVPQDQMKTLAGIVEHANAEWLVPSAGLPHAAAKFATYTQPQGNMDVSIVTEIANIIVGVYMTAINEFCKLNIYHTVPVAATDMIQSLLDEALAQMSSQAQAVFLVENEFTVKGRQLVTYLLIVPSAESINTLVDSIEQARAVCYEDKSA